MELRFKPQSSDITNYKNINQKSINEFYVVIDTKFTDDRFSDELTVMLEDNSIDNEEKRFCIFIDLNKNQALYLANFLLSYYNEKE